MNLGRPRWLEFEGWGTCEKTEAQKRKSYGKNCPFTCSPWAFNWVLISARMSESYSRRCQGEGGEPQDRTKQDNHQSSHLAGKSLCSHKPERNTHNIHASSRYPKRYFLSQYYRKISPGLKIASSHPTKLKNKPQKYQMVSKEFICIPEKSQEYLKECKMSSTTHGKKWQCLASNQKLSGMPKSKQIQSIMRRKINQ